MCRINSYKTEKFDYYNALSLADRAPVPYLHLPLAA